MLKLLNTELIISDGTHHKNGGAIERSLDVSDKSVSLREQSRQLREASRRLREESARIAFEAGLRPDFFPVDG